MEVAPTLSGKYPALPSPYAKKSLATLKQLAQRFALLALILLMGVTLSRIDNIGAATSIAKADGDPNSGVLVEFLAT